MTNKVVQKHRHGQLVGSFKTPIDLRRSSPTNYRTSETARCHEVSGQGEGKDHRKRSFPDTCTTQEFESMCKASSEQ